MDRGFEMQPGGTLQLSNSWRGDSGPSGRGEEVQVVIPEVL